MLSRHRGDRVQLISIHVHVAVSKIVLDWASPTGALHVDVIVDVTALLKK